MQPRLTAALADRYTILRELGAGGMATVFLARDLKHDRDVAIKVLHPDLGESLGVERFLSEIRTTAKLQHPHILPLLDSGTADGLLFYVMPFVEGETLRARLERERQLPIEDAVQIAREVADALGAAHALGIVHRDIKPENILLRAGHAMVADFGIALAVQQAGGARLTQTGLSLGTPHYMSPEQAMGERAIDARTDVYALGAVTYEMLTGEPPFTGATAQAVVSKAMTEQPQRLSAVRDSVPAHVESAVNKALAKLPADRWTSAAKFAESLGHLGAAEVSRVALVGTSVAGRTSAGPSWGSFAVGAAAALAMALGVWAAVGGRGGAGAGAESMAGAYRFTVPAPDASEPVVSPDGKHLVFATGTALLLRTLEGDTVRRVEGSDGARTAFWSSDSKWIAFIAGEQLKKVAVDGGSPQQMAKLPEGRATGSWSSQGTILVEITENAANEGWFILERGAQTFTKWRTLERDGVRNPEKSYPTFLPDGEHFLFTQPSPTSPTLMVGSVRSEETQALGPTDSRAEYASGHLLYVREGTLFAQPFVPEARRVTGEAMGLVNDLEFFPPVGRASFSASQTGLLVSQRSPPKSRLRWVERDGRQTGTLLEAATYWNARLSADNRRVVLQMVDWKRSTSDIWIADVARGVAERRTSAPRAEMAPRISPDGRRVVFSADWEGPPNLYVMEVDGGEPRVLVPFDKTEHLLGGWTPDGKQVVYSKRNDALDLDLWVVDVATGERRVVLATSYEERRPTVSPNGRWLAYASNASGRLEVYLRDFPSGAWQVRVSMDGGGDPVWRDDGKELFFYRPDGMVMAVEIEGGAGRPNVGTAVRLFGVDPRGYRGFDVAKGGRRFLVNLVETEGLGMAADVAVNWPQLLRRR